MPVYVDKAKRRWRFTFNRKINGQRLRATKLLPKAWGRAEAEKYDRQETARLYAIATGVRRDEPLIDAAVQLYLDHRAPKLRDAKKAAQNLAHLYDYFQGRRISELGAVSHEYITDNPGLSEGTLHNRLATLKAAGRYAWKRHKLTKHDPTGHMEIPRPKNVREVQIPVSVIEQLLERLKVIDEPSCALFTLAFRTGSRWIKGIHARHPEDVVRSGRDVWLRIGITKNGTPRMKWVHPEARWALAFIPFPRRPEFYYRRFCLARTEVGLPNTWAHDMRHVVATDIRMRGGSLEDVGAVLDHLSRQSSERYAHVMPAQIKRVLAGVGSRRMHTAARRRAPKKAA